MTLTEFLLARIDEDEADALLATTDGVGPNEKSSHWELGKAEACQCCTRIDVRGAMLLVSDTITAPHIVRFDPARVLAECEAKRRIVETFPDPADGDGWINAGETVLELLALPYTEHPDYWEGWKP